MDFVFLTFANDKAAPLASLTEEDDKIYAQLARRVAQGHFYVYREPVASRDKLISYLTLYREVVSVFLFSGHAGRDRLFATDGGANSEGVAQLLAQCPRLKLVILNGCSTQGQVARLRQLPSSPVVIATSAPVGDRTATAFSTTLFQLMAEERLPIGEAFTGALAAAQVMSPTTIGLRSGLDLGEEGAEAATWGIFPDSGEPLAWKLPDGEYDRRWLNFKVNEVLVQKLLEAFAPVDKRVKNILEGEQMGMLSDSLAKHTAIQDCLPYIICKHLKALWAMRRPGVDMVYYDQLDLHRLRQIGLTYRTTVEFMAFTMLAQLWQAKTERPDLAIGAEPLGHIRHFFKLGAAEREKYDFFGLIQAIRLVFEEAGQPYFITEFEGISQVFNEQSAFYHACVFLEKARVQAMSGSLSEGEAAQLCMLAEDKLATVLGRIAFARHYVLTSVKNIYAIKYRHWPATAYRYNMVRFTANLESTTETMRSLAYTSSVFLVKEEEADPERKFLNLTPFIIDENALDAKATEAKLQWFDYYDPHSDTCYYKHIEKPGDPRLAVSLEGNFRIVKEQFEAFMRLLFNQNAAEL